MRIQLENGKYTYVFDRDTGQSYALRYGEQWRSLTGDNLIFGMACRIEELQQQRDELASENADLEKLLGECRDAVGEFDTDMGEAMTAPSAVPVLVKGRFDKLAAKLEPVAFGVEITSNRCFDFGQRYLVDVFTSQDSAEREQHSYVAAAEATVVPLCRLSATLQPAQPDAVPEGWQIVPKVPTPEMVAAYWKERNDSGGAPSFVWEWNAVLAAAPQPDNKEDK